MIKGKLIEDFYCSLASDSNEIFSDVDMNLGGSCQGLNPHEILEAALSACTMMTIQSYAKRKKILLNSLEVNVSIDREGDHSSLTRSIKFDENLDKDVESKLLEIAEKCPIHKLLVSNISIDTEVK